MASDSRDEALLRDVLRWYLSDHAVEVARHLLRIREHRGLSPWIPDDWMDFTIRTVAATTRMGLNAQEMDARMLALTVSWQFERHKP